MDPSNIRMVDVSFEVNELAASLRGQVQTLKPLYDYCCIYRVPPKIRMSNETLYTPKMVSIGPLHHGREELKAIQEHKLRYLDKFLQRARDVSLEVFLTKIKGKEEYLRNCYVETIDLRSDEFVKMVLLDAVFLLEIFLGSNSEDETLDRIFKKPGMIKDIVLDIMLLENQLPIFILEDLFTLAKLNITRNSVSQLAKYFIKKYICEAVSIDESLIDESSIDSQAKHFVDLLRICLKPRDRNGTETQRLPDCEVVPNVTKLHQAGVKFKLAPKECNLLDIKFIKGTLEIPKLSIGNMTEQFLRNLQIFEGLHGDTNYMNDYGVILNRLLNTPKDVEFLIHIGVIENRTLDSEGVSTLFQQLSKDARVDINNFYYSGLVTDLQSYCKSPCHKRKASLKQNYFNTPWASIVVIGYVILFVLTLIQTVCSIIQTVYSIKGP